MFSHMCVYIHIYMKRDQYRFSTMALKIGRGRGGGRGRGRGRGSMKSRKNTPRNKVTHTGTPRVTC